MAKILIYHDEPGLRTFIKRYATFEGYDIIEAGDGMEAVETAKTEPVDLIIINIIMPELDGFSVLKEIRKTSDVPVIMLSARGELYDKILGFELGVDDYIVKPFSSKEIMLRIAAILRRAGKKINDNGHSIFIKDGFMADQTVCRVFIDGEEVELAPKIYDLLFFLIRNKTLR